MNRNQKILNFVWDSYCKPKKIPLFQISTDKVGTLSSANEFYTVLIKGIRESRFRINLSSLYIGNGPMERFMLEEILKASDKNKYLKVNIVLDRLRGQRITTAAKESSYSILADIYRRANNPQNLNFVFSQHNRLPRFLDFLNKTGINEMFGTFHCKQYVFDNTVVLTGANLEKEYFTYRADRYIYLNNAKDFADYLEDFNQIFIETGDRIGLENNTATLKYAQSKDLRKQIEHLFKLFLYNSCLGDKEENDREEEVSNFANRKQDPRDFLFLLDPARPFASSESPTTGAIKEVKSWSNIDEVQNEIKHSLDQLEDKYKHANRVILSSPSPASSIILVPSFQIPLINYTGEQELVMGLLDFLIKSDSGVEYNLTLTTGYFNPTDDLLGLFAQLPAHIKVDIIAAAPHSNSFFKGRGFKKRVPGVYRVALQRWLAALESNQNIRFYEYSKHKSTYHSKGMWLLAKSSSGVEYLTIYGSSNYAKRSYLKDLESQFMIFANTPREVQMFEEERKEILKHCHIITNQIIMDDRTTRVSLMNKLIYRILKNFV